jgi:DNA-3-methyladenine glycosylase II
LLSPADYARVTRRLIRRDPVLGRVIKQIGPCGMAARQHADHLRALAGAIIGQQLSTKAAATIFARFLALFPDQTVTVPGLSACGDAALRGVGLSGQKLGYLRDLCARIQDGSLRLEELDVLPDEDVIERLTAVKGFGRWTAEMFLMFRLHRPDVLPVGDLGIQKAIQRVYRLRELPRPERMLTIGEAWRPYRSVACWYLWQSLKSESSTTPAPPRRRSPRASRAR